MTFAFNFRQCHVTAMALTWHCHWRAIALPWHRHLIATSLPWQLHDRVYGRGGWGMMHRSRHDGLHPDHSIMGYTLLHIHFCSSLLHCVPLQAILVALCWDRVLNGDVKGSASCSCIRHACTCITLSRGQLVAQPSNRGNWRLHCRNGQWCHYSAVLIPLPMGECRLCGSLRLWQNQV
jgi:hypothetical protein